MRPGKISQAVYERSVIRPLEKTGALPETGPGQDHFRDRTAVCSTSSGVVDGFCMPRAEMVLDEALNQLGPVFSQAHLSATLMLPPDFEEAGLKELVTRLGDEAFKADAVIGSCLVSVSAAVSGPVLSVYAAGEADTGTKAHGRFHRPAGNLPDPCRKVLCQSLGGAAGQDLVMAGTCGMAGAVVLAGSFRESLAKRFPESFLRAAEEAGGSLLPWLALKKAAAGAAETALKDAGSGLRPGAFRAVGEGGVFAALWEFCEHLGCGLDADVHKIPVRQETVELCEYLNRNPYRLYGTGAVLIAAADGKQLKRQFLEAGIQAEVIGKLTEGPGKYIHNRQVTRCLEKPLSDALLEEG